MLTNLKLVEKLSEIYSILQKSNGSRIQTKINKIIKNINEQQGTIEFLLNWIEQNELNNFKQIDYLRTIENLIKEININYNIEKEKYVEVTMYLSAIQLIWLYRQDPSCFEKACDYSNYCLEKKRFDETLKDFNCTWKKIRSSETHGKLVVKFPKATSISNGQRDILTFISMLFRAKRHLKKEENILIIDEVFDYLDDANLTAAQYYISNFIKEYKKDKKRIYPLILTHLDPSYFKNFTFNEQKVYYLDKSASKSNIHINESMKNLLRKRNDPSIKDDVDKYLLHYHPDKINKRAEFKNLGLSETWGEANCFSKHLEGEIDNYLNDRPYDPFSVCGALRIKIEETAYKKLQSDEAKIEFLDTHKTRSKLEKAEEKGVISPESHYLLGIIYNEAMHWKEDRDNVSPIASKLENLIIKKLIRDVFEFAMDSKT
jgi:hypothetical protein